MNFHLKNKNLTRALYLCLALCGAIAFYFIITNIGGALSWIGNVVGAAMPVVFGFVIAYFLRPLVNKFESLFAKLSRKKNRKKRPKKPRMKRPRREATFCPSARRPAANGQPPERFRNPGIGRGRTAIGDKRLPGGDGTSRSSLRRKQSGFSPRRWIGGS